ncbi:MAG: hypothetical protein HRU13_00065 [Phycisphaerales bacterium]|nr:hypothetical protein [Phycisphaerales bacterium]
MKITTTTLAVGALLAAAGTTFAQVSPGSFTPTQTDDYESYPGGRTSISSVFGGTVPIIIGSVDHRSVDAGDWLDFRSPGGPVAPVSGSKFGVQFGFGDFTYDFTGIGGVSGFSFWATAAGVGSDTIEFFDMSGSPIGSFTDSDGWGPGDGTMEFLSFTSSTLIGSARVTGRETCFDDIAIDAVPPAPCQDWTPFTWGTLGDVVTVPVDVTSSCRFIKVTDAFLSGDEFSVRVLDGGSEIAAFDTSPTTIDGESIGSDYDGAFDDERWSSGFVEISTPGSYTVEVTVTRDPFGGGGAAVRVDDNAPLPPGEDILVLDQNSRNGYAASAAANLGDTTVAGTADFNTLLTSQAWAAVALDMPSTLLTDFGPIVNYINDGGKVVVSTWGDTGFGGWPQLLTPMGATGGSSFSTQANPSITSTGTPEADAIFDSVTTPITDFSQFWGSDGVQATLAGGSVPVAQQAGAGNPVVWVGNDGRTIGSWVADEMNDGAQAIQLWENYLNFVLGGDTGCRADCDEDGSLTIFDFLCFQNAFDSMDPYADFDDDGLFTIFDFLAFQNEFDAGCD